MSMEKSAGFRIHSWTLGIDKNIAKDGMLLDWALKQGGEPGVTLYISPKYNTSLNHPYL